MNTSTGTSSGKRTMADTSLETDGGTYTRRKKGRDLSYCNQDYFIGHLKWKRDWKEAKEKKKEERAQASIPHEIDVYSEQVVITQLQFVMKKYCIDDKQMSLAVPHLLDPSFRKMFVHVAEKFQAQ